MSGARAEFDARAALVGPCGHHSWSQHGVAIDRTVQDFHARVVQHECDHLDGLLYPMRIADLRNFGFSAALFPGEDLADD